MIYEVKVTFQSEDQKNRYLRKLYERVEAEVAYRGLLARFQRFSEALGIRFGTNEKGKCTARIPETFTVALEALEQIRQVEQPRGKGRLQDIAELERLDIEVEGEQETPQVNNSQEQTTML